MLIWCIQVFTGRVPFPDDNQVIAMRKIVGGERPSRPSATELGLSDELWAVIQSSLASEVEKRPMVSVFEDLLGRVGPETVLVVQSEEIINISDGSVSYLTSEPIPSGKRLKKVVVTVVSKDQGWSSFPDDHGTYRGSWTWFELSVGPPSAESGERWRGEVVRNLHAHRSSRSTPSRFRTEAYTRRRRAEMS